ncbi:MAG TPA: PH domain-containing protein [Chloroflexota bacterium]|nr:PH domain-containing protein [Chloroflexota bacterium]
MTRTPNLSAEVERRLLVVRRHWWILIRPLLPLAILLILLPLYATLDYLLPAADLSQYDPLFLWGDCALAGIVLVKWVAADLAPWLTERFIFTSRRVLIVRGVLRQEQRELALHQVGEVTCAVRGASGRFLQFGDLTVHSTGPGSSLIVRCIPQPRKIQGMLAAHTRAARGEHLRGHDRNAAIGAALERILQGSSAGDAAPTLEVSPITTVSARAQRRLNLLPGEVVLAASRRHRLSLWGRLAGGVLLAGGFMVPIWMLFPRLSLTAAAAAAMLLTAWACWSLFAWSNLLYALTSMRVVELRCSPLFRTVRQEISLASVQDTAVRRLLAGGYIWDVGTLVLETADDGAHLLRALPRPESFQARLRLTLEAARKHEHFKEQERLAATLTDWFEEYHRLQSGR